MRSACGIVASIGALMWTAVFASWALICACSTLPASMHTDIPGEACESASQKVVRPTNHTAKISQQGSRKDSIQRKMMPALGVDLNLRRRRWEHVPRLSTPLQHGESAFHLRTSSLAKRQVDRGALPPEAFTRRHSQGVGTAVSEGCQTATTITRQTFRYGIKWP